MTIDFEKIRGTFREWVFLTLISTLNDAEISKILDNVKEKGKYDIDIFINRVSCDFENMIERLEKEYERGIKECAIELCAKKVTDKILRITDALESLEKNIKEHIECEIDWEWVNIMSRNDDE